MITKDFINIANILREPQYFNNKEIILEFLLDVLSRLNPKFNSIKFTDWVNKID